MRQEKSCMLPVPLVQSSKAATKGGERLQGQDVAVARQGGN